MDAREAFVRETMSRDIELAIEALRPLGIPLYLLDYPENNLHMEQTFDRFAGVPGVVRVRVGAEFRKLLETAPRERYFVPDGHCNERGYGIMADVVFAALRPLLEQAVAAPP